ncbi:KamA family radical SAM protein [bacterium]|nr:KamA family radical SAM protein [bacterium]
MEEAPDTEVNEFANHAASHDSVTAAGARAFGVDPATFANWRWQMKHQIASRADAERVLNLAGAEAEGFDALKDIFQSGITPYYLMLMMARPGDPELPPHLHPVRLQGLPRTEELSDALGVPDPLDEVGHSPVREVVHVYPDRVAFCVAQLCPVYCRYCFRKRRDEETGLHFNRAIVDRGIDYIASNPAIKDVLVTGGDPFIASDSALENLVARLRAIPHVEIIRFGTRTPVTLPYRVTRALAQRLAKYHPIFVNTHFNCAEELTPEARQAIANLVDAGIPVGNQSVLLRNVNDTTARMMPLLRGLLRARVRPYYLFHPHRVAGTEHLRVPVKSGIELMKKLRGNITGLAIPTYILDTPSGKVPLTPNHILREDGDDLVIEDCRGEIWREKGVVESTVEPR